MNRNIILLAIVSTAVFGALAQREYRPSREFGDALPMTAFAAANGTSNATTSPQYEPSACSQCLDDRYLLHYYQRGCKPVNSELFCKKSCAKYFDCPPKKIVTNGCEYKGKLYKLGEKVPVDNPCLQGCFCDPELDAKNMSHPNLVCAHVDCFRNFNRLEPNCYLVQEPGKCCSKQVCVNQTQAQNKCAFEGSEYLLGQTMYSKIDPCVKCLCDAQWDTTRALNNTNCQRITCGLENNRKFRAGCLPIYHEKVCCPIDYYCPPPEEYYCKFGGKKYLIGEKLDIDYARTECKCVVPPDFTCIQKSYQESAPKTLLATNIPKLPKPLPEIQSKPNITNPLPPLSTLLPKPVCPPHVAGGLACAGINCTTIIDNNGCQACRCQQSCPLLNCGNSCVVAATTPGVCPHCKCD